MAGGLGVLRRRKGAERRARTTAVAGETRTPNGTSAAGPSTAGAVRSGNWLASRRATCKPNPT